MMVLGEISRNHAVRWVRVRLMRLASKGVTLRPKPTLAIVGTMIAFGLASSAGASPAQAYYGNAYLVVNNSRCPNGGHVTGIFGAVGDTWTGGDWGDNIIYVRDSMNSENQFNGRAFCKNPWYLPSYFSQWINVVGWDFYPTHSPQTFWY